MKWKSTCEIKQILYNEDLSVAEKASLIAVKLENHGVFPQDLIDGFLFIGDNPDDEHLSDSIDDELEVLYDFADENKIWLGL